MSKNNKFILAILVAGVLAVVGSSVVSSCGSTSATGVTIYGGNK